MKTDAKSRITLLPEDSKLVATLQVKLKVKSRIEVVRRGLRLLKETMGRAPPRPGWRWAPSWRSSIT